MRIDDENTNGYYVVQWTSEPYIPQKYKEMKGYISIVIAYTGDIVCDAVFFNPIPNAKYWLTPMNKGDRDIIVRLKLFLLPKIIMMKIDLRCNKKQAKQLGALRIRNDAID